MARRSSVIRVSVVGDAKDLNRAFQQAERSAQSFGQQMSGLGDRMTRNVTLPLAAGFTMAFKASEQQAKAEAQLNNVLRSTGGIAGVTADHVTDLASALQETTTFGDEATIAGANLLLTFKNLRNEAGQGNDIFDRTTSIMLDMSTAMDQDLKSSAIQLGKALNDPIEGISALSRVGITFSDDQKAMIRSLQESGDLLGAQKIILQELESQFKGSAAAVAETAGGQLTQAMNTLGDAGETVGSVIAPAVIDVANAVKGGAEAFQNLSDGTQESIVKFGLLLAAAGPLLSIVGRLITHFNTLRVAILGASAASAAGGFTAGAGGVAAGARAGGSIAAVRATATGAAGGLAAGTSTGGTLLGGVIGVQVGQIAGGIINDVLGDPFGANQRRAVANEAGFSDGFFFTGSQKQYWAGVWDDIFGDAERQARAVESATEGYTDRLSALGGEYKVTTEAGRLAELHVEEVSEAYRFQQGVASDLYRELHDRMNPELSATTQHFMDAKVAQERFNDAANTLEWGFGQTEVELLRDVGVAIGDSVSEILQYKAALEAQQAGGPAGVQVTPGTPTTGARPNALGGRYRAGELLLAGEVGPEVMVPDHDGTMIPNRHLRGGGGGGQPVQIINHFHGVLTQDQVREIDRQLEQLRGGRVA